MSALTLLPWFAVPRRIYVASSWRNEYQQRIVGQLRDAGHEVYDFRNPAPGNIGFSWAAIDPEWLNWGPGEFADRVQAHPIAQRGFFHDKAALDWCDTCVMVLPCGRSAHLEAGYAAGQGKRVIWWLHPDRFEPELMYLLGHEFVVDHDAIEAWKAAEGEPRRGVCRCCGKADLVNNDQRCIACFDGVPAAEAASAVDVCPACGAKSAEACGAAGDQVCFYANPARRHEL